MRFQIPSLLVACIILYGQGVAAAPAVVGQTDMSLSPAVSVPEPHAPSAAGSAGLPDTHADRPHMPFPLKRWGRTRRASA
ncbi:hypothetical protein B0H15DRAFT_848434 [Mycena belliarum]|uniref:Uncharacterized protein n=1 Tax=Mycena belliarum TaxID=1033014 RepID=A0AAD6U3T0_9AGAR|nr:hypothetical protein B0H15DRAFT_848434 [Mycena belliae]